VAGVGLRAGVKVEEVEEGGVRGRREWGRGGGRGRARGWESCAAARIGARARAMASWTHRVDAVDGEEADGCGRGAGVAGQQMRGGWRGAGAPCIGDARVVWRSRRTRSPSGGRAGAGAALGQIRPPLMDSSAWASSILPSKTGDAVLACAPARITAAWRAGRAATVRAPSAWRAATGVPPTRLREKFIATVGWQTQRWDCLERASVAGGGGAGGGATHLASRWWMDRAPRVASHPMDGLQPPNWPPLSSPLLSALLCSSHYQQLHTAPQ
jgi:hypothetical protein